MNPRLKPLAVLTATLFISPNLLADTLQDSDKNLTGVIVTATRQPQRANESVADVTVIERTQIEESVASTLGELLGQQAGLQTNRTGGLGHNESLYMRGSNSDHVLVLVDGTRVGSATLGITSLEMIPLAQIERIEILRGGASSLYGADAMAGVIQIFTRNQSTPRTTFSVGAGNLGTYESSFSHQGRYGDWSYSLSAGDSGSQGVNQIRNKNSSYFNPDKDGYHNQNLAAGLRYKISGGEIGYRHLNSDSTNHYDSATLDASYNTVLANADWKMHHRISSDSLWVRKKLTERWHSALTFGQGEDETTSTPSSDLGKQKDRFKTLNKSATWQNDVTLPLGTALLAYEYLEQSIDSTSTYVSRSRTINSTLLGWNADIGQHSLQVNYRNDQNSQFGQRENYTLGYAFRINDQWKIAALGGTAFKAPTFNQLYFPPTPGVGIGNPSLKPESSRNKEIRINYTGRIIEASLTRFDNQIKNMINWGDAPAPYYLTPSNVGEARISGWEGSISARLGQWNMGSNLTFQNPRDSEGHQLNHRSRRHGILYLGYDTGDWKARIEVTGQSGTFDDPANTRALAGYSLVNLYADKRINNEWTLFARANNIFDRDYLVSRTNEAWWADKSQYYGQGATVLVGLRYASK